MNDRLLREKALRLSARPTQAKGRRRRNKLGNIERPLTSYEVFSKYIVQEESSTGVDVSKIFSRKCFLEWLATRPSGKLKYPAQSYQRVLYAHIRGSDQRRCFKQPVEKELLKLLRGGNPWTEVFKDEKEIIGKRGFPGKGFYESLQMKEKKQRSTSLQPSEGTTFKIVKYGKKSQTSQNSKRIRLVVDNSEVQISKINYLFEKTIQVPGSVQNKATPWDMVKDVLNHYVEVEARKQSLVLLNKRGVNLWSAATKFYLNEVVDPNDFRFSNQFIFPSIEHQVFRSDRPVASLLLSPSNRITHQDDEALKLFGCSLMHRHGFEVAASYVSLCYGSIRTLPSLYLNGVVWRRDVLKRTEGSPMVCLTRSIKNGQSIIWHLQDQSDIFPDILKSVCLI